MRLMTPQEESDLQGMVKHLDDDLEELKGLFRDRREKTEEKFDAMLEILHRIDKNQEGQDKRIKSNSEDIKRHGKYFYIAWTFIAGLFMMLLKLLLSGSLVS